MRILFGGKDLDLPVAAEAGSIAGSHDANSRTEDRSPGVAGGKRNDGVGSGSVHRSARGRELRNLLNRRLQFSMIIAQ